MLRQVGIVCFAGLLSTSFLQAAPLLETLYQQGDVLDGASTIPGFTVFETVRLRGSSRVTATPNGSFVTSVRTNPFEPSDNSARGIYYIFGSDDRGDNPIAMRREAVVAGIDQQNLTSPSIDYSGNTTYLALTGNNGLAGSGDSGIWEDDVPFAYPGDAITAGPLSGNFFQTLTSVYRSPAGVTSWVSQYSTTSGGSSIGYALFNDLTTQNVLLQSGDVIPGLGTLSSSGFAISNVTRSQLGTNYIAEIDIVSANTSADEAPILNGAALQMQTGEIIVEGAPIPGGLSLPDGNGGFVPETWDIFGLTDVNESGDWIMSVFTDAASADDNLLVVNGEIVHREGTTLDGVPLAGQVQNVGINDRGDIAFVWNDTLFINDQAIAGATTIEDFSGSNIAGLGTLVDTDDDGVADTAINGNGFSLDQFEITNLVAAGGDNLPIVYASATVGSKTSVFRFVAPEDLNGDYNGDGVVDAADYTVWRDTLGSEALLDADGNENNIIDAGDYTVWLNNFGMSLSSASQASSVPEPSSAILILLALLSQTRRLKNC